MTAFFNALGLLAMELLLAPFFIMKKVDLIGRRYGKLLVIREVEERKNRQIYWECICDCGNKKNIPSNSLTNLTSNSCGCLSIHNLDRTTHGHTTNFKISPEYRTWVNMKTRCYNSKSPFYSHYGGRGIVVCDKWATSFQNFINDMGRKPTPNHTLERLNNDGNYELLNCKWATKKEQASNRRSSVKIEYNGTILTMAQWAAKLNINYKQFFYKFRVLKIPMSKIIEYLSTI